MTVKKNIEEVTAKELGDFAEVRLGLVGIHYKLGKDRILAKMREAGFEGDEIDVPGQVGDAIQDGSATRLALPSIDEEKVRIRIPNQHGIGGRDDVPVGVNGRVYLIKRETDVDVPISVVKVLENALTREYERDEDGSIKNPTDVLTHPFQIIATRPQKAA